MEADKLAIRRFIEGIHGADPKGWLILWTRRDKLTRAFDLSTETALDQATAYCAECGAQQDVYAAVGLQSEEPAGGSRGKEDSVVSVPGAWMDVDIAGPAHKSKDLPPTEREAMQLVEAVGLPPSVIVMSGHGLQPYWLFDKPLIIETEAHLQNSRSLSRRFQQMLRIQAQTHGWKVDSTADLCRVLRVPGTFNHKISNDIRPVTAEYFERTYCPEDVEGLLSGLDDPGALRLAEPQLDLPPANLRPILGGCAWMLHCQDDAPALPEPEWFYILNGYRPVPGCRTVGA